MSGHSLHKAGDLPPDERLLVERWLGRPLSHDDVISVKAYRPDSTPVGEERELLRQDIISQAREIGSRINDGVDEDVDALVDDAILATRATRG